MLEDGPGQVISVESASLRGIAPDQPFSRLHGHLGPLVGPGVVGGAHPVYDPKLEAESLHLPGGEHFGPVTGQHNRDAEDGHVGKEDVDDLLAGIPLQLEDRQPVAISVHHSQVGVRCDGEEVSTDGLEGVAGLIRNDRGHGGVAGLVFGTSGAGSSVVDEVHTEAGPVQGGGCPLKHSGGTLVAGVEMVHDTFPQGVGDDGPVMKQDYRAHRGEGVPVGVEVLDLLVPGVLVVGDALLHRLVLQVYWGQVMQADSSLGQKMACALDSTEKPLMLDQEITSAMQATE